MATDYDTPRKTDEELHEESLEELKAKRVDAQSGLFLSKLMSSHAHAASWSITLLSWQKVKALKLFVKSATKSRSLVF